jgi:hypothetical protein
LKTFTLITGYNILVPPSTVVSTGSQTDACNAITYVTSTPNFTYTSINGQAAALLISEIVYADNGTTDCSVVPDGWYFTDESANTSTDVYHIVSGVIVSRIPCFAPPTTTTTTTLICSSYTVSKSTVGVVTVTYTDCTGVLTTVSIGLVGGGPSSTTFCAQNGSVIIPFEVTLTNNGIC